MKKILYISGSLGLGHVARDLAIAKELRYQFPDTEIYWIAAEPALSVLIQAGEKTVSEVNLYNNDNEQAEAVARGPKLSQHIYAFKVLGKWFQNASLLKKILKHNNFALIIGEPEDIPDKRFGFTLPNRRQYAKKYYNFLGYILSFDPNSLNDKKRIRQKLGYGDEPLVVCSIGGTSVGKELLELCAKAYPIIKETIPNLHMVLVCGPRLSPKSLDISKDLDLREYVPNLYEHLAASDLAVTQGGGNTTLELLALK